MSFKGIRGSIRNIDSAIGSQTDLVQSVGQSLSNDLDATGMTTMKFKVDGKPTIKISQASKIIRNYCPLAVELTDPKSPELDVSVTMTVDNHSIYNKNNDLNRASQTNAYKAQKGPIMQLYSDMLKPSSERKKENKQKGCERVMEVIQGYTEGTRLLIETYTKGRNNPKRHQGTLANSFTDTLLTDLIALGWLENLCQLEDYPAILNTASAIIAGIAAVQQDWTVDGKRRSYEEVLEALNLNHACKLRGTKRLVSSIKIMLLTFGSLSLVGAILRNFSYPTAIMRQLRSWVTLRMSDESKIDPMALVCLKKSAFINDVAVPIKIPTELSDYRDATVVRLALRNLRDRGMLRRSEFAEYKAENNQAEIVHASFTNPADKEYVRKNKATVDEMLDYYQKLAERRVLPWQQICLGIFGLILLIINYFIPPNTDGNPTKAENLFYTASQIAKTAVQNYRGLSSIPSGEALSTETGE